jgi:hypothetical protein
MPNTTQMHITASLGAKVKTERLFAFVLRFNWVWFGSAAAPGRDSQTMDRSRVRGLRSGSSLVRLSGVDDGAIDAELH